MKGEACIGKGSPLVWLFNGLIIRLFQLSLLLIMLMIMVRSIGNARLVVCGAPRWFGLQILFSNQKQSSVWKTKTGGEVEVLAGSYREEGSVDG